MSQSEILTPTYEIGTTSFYESHVRPVVVEFLGTTILVFFCVYVSCYFFYYLPERLRLWICHTVPHCEFWWHQVSNLKNFRLYMECLHNVTYCSSFCFEYFLIWCTLYRKKKWFFNFCYFLAFNCCYKTLIITNFKSSCQR